MSNYPPGTFDNKDDYDIDPLDVQIRELRAKHAANSSISIAAATEIEATAQEDREETVQMSPTSLSSSSESSPVLATAYRKPVQAAQAAQATQAPLSGFELSVHDTLDMLDENVSTSASDDGDDPPSKEEFLSEVEVMRHGLTHAIPMAQSTQLTQVPSSAFELSVHDALNMLDENVSTSASDNDAPLSKEFLLTEVETMVAALKTTSLDEELSGKPSSRTAHFNQLVKAMSLVSAKHQPRTSGSTSSNARSHYDIAVALYTEEAFRYLDAPQQGAQLHHFDSRVWIPLSDSDLDSLLWHLLSEKEKQSIRKWSAFRTDIRQILEVMAAVSFKQGDLFSEQDFRVVDNRIVFNNLIYDAMTGEKLPFSSTLPYTRAVNANFIEDDLPTPAYDQLRRDATGDDSTSVDMFDFMLGYLLVPNRSGKCFFCLGTAPDSGKSLILDFCVSMFGARSIPVEPEKLGGRFAFERAPSAQLLYCKDVTTEHLSPKSISQIKIASGDKEIRSEGKGKTETTAPIRFKMIFATNDKMKGKGDKPDPAFYRRMIVLPFIHSAEDHMESDMAQRLLEERDAILSHAARKLYSIIDHKGGIRIPESSLSINMKKSWYEPQDFMEYFIENVVEHAGDYKSFLSKEELYEAYENFSRVCKENGLAGSLCTSKDFNQRLLILMDGLTYTRARTERSPENAVYGFRNIRWKTK